MQKRLLLAAVAAVCFTACQNDYTCRCDIKIVENSAVDQYEEVFKIKEATKSQARSACIEARIVVEDSWGRVEQKCELD